MYSKGKTIAKIEGIVLILLSISMSPSLIIAAFYNETKSFNAFFSTIMLTVILGVIIFMCFNCYHFKFKNRDGYLLVALTCIIVIIIGALPYWLSGAIPNFIDAFFESCSGFTTTGASILTDVESMPMSLLFWRSFTSWLGGFFIVILVTAIIPTFVMEGQVLSDVDSATLSKFEVAYNFAVGSKGIYKIYLGATALEIILLIFAGLNTFDAFVHTFGTVSTGGFSSYNDGISHFDSIAVEMIILIFMFTSALNYNLYFLTKKRGLKSIFKDEETRFYCYIIIIVGTILALYNMVFNIFNDELKNIGETIFDAFFQVVSIISTTGYTTDNFNTWATFAKFIILALFLVGGCSNSASGGIKCVRIIGAFKLIIRGIYLKIHPNIISPVTLNHNEMSNETAIKISNYVFTYLTLIAAGTVVLSINGSDFITNFSASLSCLGNIGPGFNLVNPTMNYAIFHDFSKLFCSFLMITGRLELYCILVLFSKSYWNSNRTK